MRPDPDFFWYNTGGDTHTVVNRSSRLIMLIAENKFGELDKFRIQPQYSAPYDFVRAVCAFYVELPPKSINDYPIIWNIEIAWNTARNFNQEMEKCG